MKAVIVRAPMQFGVEDVPIPDVPDGGMLLKVIACGLCGSDLRTLRSGHRKVTFPWIIGHELCAEVVALGSGYQGPWQENELLAVGPLVYCGECDYCKTDRYELCDNYTEIAQKWPGAFAEYIAIPEASVKRGTIQVVPEGLDPAFAAITEPVSSCVNAQEKGEVGSGSTVAIIGAGPVGCIHASLARTNGASRVFIADISKDRLDLANVFDPDAIIDVNRSDLVEDIHRRTKGKGADVVITATSAPEAPVQAVRMAAKGGRILLFGGLSKKISPPAIDLNLVHYNALHLMGTTIFAPRHNQIALDLIASGKVPADKLITHRFKLIDFRDGAMMALGGKVLKAVFMP